MRCVGAASSPIEQLRRSGGINLAGEAGADSSFGASTGAWAVSNPKFVACSLQLLQENHNSMQNSIAARIRMYCNLWPI